MFFLLHVFLLYFCPFQAIFFSFYRTLGSVQWVSMSVCNCCDFSDVTLADEDTNSILADDAFILYLWGIAVFYLHSFWNFAYICFRWFLHFGYFFMHLFVWGGMSTKVWIGLLFILLLVDLIVFDRHRTFYPHSLWIALYQIGQNNLAAKEAERIYSSNYWEVFSSV